MEKGYEILVGCFIIAFAIIVSSFSIGISQIDLNQLNTTPININITDLHITGNFTGNFIYGEMWFHNDTVSSITQIDATDTYYMLEAFDGTQNKFNTSLNGFDYNGGNLTAHVSGKYKVDFHLTGTDGANTRWHAVIFVNSEEKENTESHERISNIADVMQLSGSGFIDLNVGDNVSLYVLNEDTTADLSVISANVNLIRIGN